MTEKTNSTLSTVALLLTLLSQVPYEQGWLSTVLPPSIKPYVAMVCLGATGILRIMKDRGWCK